MAAQKKQSTSKPKTTKGKNKYSILLPTYNEKQNLPLITQMIVTALEPQFSLNEKKINNKMMC